MVDMHTEITPAWWLTYLPPNRIVTGMNSTATKFQPGARVRRLGQPGNTGTVVEYFKPLPSGNVNVRVDWDYARSTTLGDVVLESVLEAIPA